MMFRQQMKQAAAISTDKGMKMEILSWLPAEITKFNGVNAIKMTYSRSMKNKPPAIVNIYLIQNNDCMHTITISYRTTEEHLWANDLGKVIDTFKFNKR